MVFDWKIACQWLTLPASIQRSNDFDGMRVYKCVAGQVVWRGLRPMFIVGRWPGCTNVFSSYVSLALADSDRRRNVVLYGL